MLGLGSTLTKAASPVPFVIRLINQHVRTEEADGAIGENPDGLGAPLKFLTQNPIGG
jgi:hypothetical protein